MPAPGDNDNSRFEWARQQRATVHAYTGALVHVLSEIRQSLQLDEHSVEFEIHAAAIWKKMADLRKFLDGALGHGEVIMGLEQMAALEMRQRFSHDKARALHNALGILEDHAALADAILERVHDALRAGGLDFDCSPKPPHQSM